MMNSFQDGSSNASAMVKMSLSPRPDMLMMIAWSGRICGASLKAWTKAWADSMAGMSPSVRFESATDREVIEALSLAMRTEGLIPAMESAHAFVQAFKDAPTMRPDQAIIINMSGRGDKDIFTIAHAFDDPSWKAFIVSRAKDYSAH